MKGGNPKGKGSRLTKKGNPKGEKGRLVVSEPVEILVPITGPMTGGDFALAEVECCLAAPQHPVVSLMGDRLHGNNLEIKLHALDPCGITQIQVYVVDLFTVTLASGETKQTEKVRLVDGGKWIGDLRSYDPPRKEIPPVPAREWFRIPTRHLWGTSFAIRVIVKTVCGRQASVGTGIRALL